MPNNYLQVTIERNWQSFNFQSPKNSCPGQFWVAPTHADIIEF